MARGLEHLVLLNAASLEPRTSDATKTKKGKKTTRRESNNDPYELSMIGKMESQHGE